MASVSADEDLRKLRDAYREDGWMIGRREHVFYAWYPKVPRGPDGLMVLKDATVAGLGLRVATFVMVFAQTSSREKAEAAALGLKT